MAILLEGSGNDRLDFGDLPIGGLTGLTVGFNIELTGAPANDLRFITQWANSGSWAFLVRSADVGEIAFAVSQTGVTGNIFSKKTSTVGMVNGGFYRVCCCWEPGTMEVWVNGTSVALTDLGTATVNSLFNSSENVFVGHQPTSNIDGVDGNYSEPFILDYFAPSFVPEGFTNGESPAFHPYGGLMYCKALNTGYLVDEFGGNTVTNTGGVNADHPFMYYPTVQRNLPPSSVIPPAGAKLYYSGGNPTQRLTRGVGWVH